MRRPIVFVLVLASFAAYAYFRFASGMPTHRVPVHENGEIVDAGVRADAGVASDGGVRDAAIDAGPVALLDRPLRVVAFDWESATAGVIGNDGLRGGPNSRFTSAGVELRLSVASNVSDVEAALARGGADETGADIAILPLPELVASYERLRALALEVFLVTARSEGREAVYGPRRGARFAFRPSGDVRVTGAPATSAGAFGLMLFDLAGVAPSRVRFADPVESTSSSNAYAFVSTSAPTDAERVLYISSADASWAVPVVAVASHAMIQTHPRALEAWSRAWLDGASAARLDVPTAARRTASLEGAPEVAVLLERLGKLGTASIRDNARLAGLSGRGVTTVETLFRRYWSLLRDAGLLTVPPPDVTPFSSNVIAALAHGANEVPAAASRRAEPGTEVMLSVRVGANEDPAERTAFIADLFPRSMLRLAGRSGTSTQSIIAAARDRFGIDPTRLLTSSRAAANGTTIEVLAVE